MCGGIELNQENTNINKFLSSTKQSKVISCVKAAKNINLRHTKKIVGHPCNIAVNIDSAIYLLN